MSIEQQSVIDAVRMESGALHLIIEDGLAWDEAHLFKLQDKINFYFSYIESGEIFAAHPGAEHCDLVIDLVLAHPPTVDALAFLRQAEAVIENAGFLFRYGPGSAGYAEPPVA